MQAYSPIMQLVRQLQGRSGEAASDGELLRQFLRQPDEATFATLVHRHGAMVFHVCRRVLANTHDIEDAFQATFLVLVQKAGKLQYRETVGDWLHGVALHTALKARAMISKRTIKERCAARSDAVLHQGDLDGWQQVLDEEIRRLPDRYRLALIQCDLQQKTRKEAAQVLGWKEGTVASSLARGRTILCKRLRARGVEITALLLATEMARTAQASAMPLTLVHSVTQAACKLATGTTLFAATSMSVFSLMKTSVLSVLNHKATVAVVFLACAATITTWGLLDKAERIEAQAAQSAQHGAVTEQAVFSSEKPAGAVDKTVLRKMGGVAAQKAPPAAARRLANGNDFEILSQLDLSAQQWLDFMMLRQTMLNQSQEMYRMTNGRRERGMEINREWNAGLMMVFTLEQYCWYSNYWEDRTFRASR